MIDFSSISAEWLFTQSIQTIVAIAALVLLSRSYKEQIATETKRGDEERQDKLLMIDVVGKNTEAITALTVEIRHMQQHGYSNNRESAR